MFILLHIMLMTLILKEQAKCFKSCLNNWGKKNQLVNIILGLFFLVFVNMHLLEIIQYLFIYFIFSDSVS